MQKLIQGALAASVGLGLWAGLATPAAASSQYSAKRSNSVRLVWRRAMGRHAMTATRGARYSKHLGLRYGNNAATVTWYTDAHEKLYEKDKHVAAIYYHVTSADGTLQGWIWRGYLKEGVAKPSTTSTPATTQQTTTTVDPNDLDPDDLQYLYDIQHAPAYAATIRSLFPGTVNDQDLVQAAGQAAYTTDGEESPTTSASGRLIRLQSVNTANQQHIDPSQYARLLSAAGYPANQRAKFTGWHIGVAIHTTETDEGINQGAVFIYLQPTA
ncbi:hypothetical protein [Levilactobacillus zymae]|uniref:hypothetical protein n=1 Tax=Levilactobacillus zymae TaxID=267363 RepID=UPI0028BB4909|nr:hypothetical protein [Levilactobacillus zymae]MDT6980726.1 hypothetical protein [Levilactobacillus zymae]